MLGSQGDAQKPELQGKGLSLLAWSTVASWQNLFLIQYPSCKGVREMRVEFSSHCNTRTHIQNGGIDTEGQSTIAITVLSLIWQNHSSLTNTAFMPKTQPCLFKEERNIMASLA